MSSSREQVLPAIRNVEKDQVDAIAGLPEHLAVIRLQYESCTSLAAAKPRNLIDIVKALKLQLVSFPSFAVKAVYNKPIGRDANRCGKCNAEFTNHKHRKCGNCGAMNVELFEGHELRKGEVEIKLGPMKFAEGLSIHAAEAIIPEYGYVAIDCQAEDVSAQFARLTATFVDLQSGIMRRDSVDVPKHFTYRDGNQGKISDDRFWGTLVPAKKSILLREVILRCIPASVKAELFDAAKDALEKALTEDQINKILETFSEWHVSQRQLELFLGKVYSKWTTADRGKLVGVFQSIKDGETSVDEMFEMMDETPSASGSDKGGSKGISTGVDAVSVLKQIAETEFDTVVPRKRQQVMNAALTALESGKVKDIDAAATMMRAELAKLIEPPADKPEAKKDKPTGTTKTAASESSEEPEVDDVSDDEPEPDVEDVQKEIVSENPNSLF